MELLHHFQPYSKSNLEAPDINMLCGVKRRPTANKCACEIINSFANLCQIENGTQMGFHTVHYLDCFARTELWICSVCATMSHLLDRQQLLLSIQYVAACCVLRSGSHRQTQANKEQEEPIKRFTEQSGQVRRRGTRWSTWQEVYSNMTREETGSNQLKSRALAASRHLKCEEIWSQNSGCDEICRRLIKQIRERNYLICCWCCRCSRFFSVGDLSCVLFCFLFDSVQVNRRGSGLLRQWALWLIRQ